MASKGRTTRVTNLETNRNKGQGQTCQLEEACLNMQSMLLQAKPYRAMIVHMVLKGRTAKVTDLTNQKKQGPGAVAACLRKQ